MDAYSCTECGRCSAACPANLTGKALSPRKIMMSTRDRLEEVGRNIDANGKFTDDGKNLLNYITAEELRACTTCNACVEECPVSISPLEIIIEMRRALIMEDSNAPQEWNVLFGNVENNFAPWKYSPDDRDKWTTEELSGPRFGRRSFSGPPSPIPSGIPSGHWRACSSHPHQNPAA